ncbi:MAG: DMT family transporter [Pseudomonadota bacterium]|nr:DMT family transporter [Pseudomonadota bacterium]
MRTGSLLLLITLSEATIGVFVKLTGGLIPIQTLNFYALSLAAAFLLTTLRISTGHRLHLPVRNFKDIFVIGVLIATQISVFNYAMTLVPIANAVIFWSIAPFFTFIFSAIFLDERARPIHVAIFAVALAGIVIAQPLEGGEMLGNLVALGDGAIYAAMITYMRHEGKTETGNDIAWSMLVAALLLAPSLWLFGTGDVTALVPDNLLPFDMPVMAAVGGLGLISTGFAYFGISLVLKTIDANLYSLVDIIVSPVVASFLGFLVFREIPGPGMVLGGAMLLGSGFWLTHEMSKRRRAITAHPVQCETPD